MAEGPIIAPSILSADFSHLARDVERVVKAGAHWIHVDVMDGVFVPNLTIGPPVVKALRGVTEAPLDVHLMIVNPERYVDAFADAGASTLTVHVEAEPHLHRCLEKIRGRKVSPGVSLNPGTPLGHLDACLPFVDLVLVMGVNPGFGGQSFIPETLLRIKDLVRTRERLGLAFNISVDGGVNLAIGKQLFQEGADVLVAGSAVYGSDNPEETVRRFTDLRRDT